MSEDTYEHECMRAELLGLGKPDQAEFERKHEQRVQQQLEEQEAAEAQMLEQQEETMRGAGGKLDELNSILSSTQQKLNRFKQTACGSLTNMFGRGSGSVDVTDDTAAAPNTAPAAAASEPPQQQQQQQQPDEPQPAISAERIRAAKAESAKKMSSQLDKLDSLINKADNAQIAMSEQTKQMRKMAK